MIAESVLEQSLLESGIGAAAAVKSNDASIPVIDMALSKEQILEQMWKAARNVGFFTVINHGIPQEDIDELFHVSETFFTNLSRDEKSKQSPFNRTLNSGYEFMAQAPPSTGTVDQKESVQITARQGCMEGRWPSDPSTFQTSTENMMTQLHELACRILSVLEEEACPHLVPGTLANAHHLWNHDGQCTLRLIRYPPIGDEARLNELTQPGNLHWRAGPHTDWGNVTLLFQRPSEEGLECMANPRGTSGEAKWIPVPPIKGGIAVNIGDMLMRWSDANLFSNVHRVRMPNTLEEINRSRYSIAFFLQADKSALIQSPSNEPITAGEFFRARIGSHFSPT
jgi:isopenicillin N synthase-like dioxygenase